jgi:hypothetical protein
MCLEDQGGSNPKLRAAVHKKPVKDLTQRPTDCGDGP